MTTPKRSHRLFVSGDIAASAVKAAFAVLCNFLPIFLSLSSGDPEFLRPGEGSPGTLFLKIFLGRKDGAHLAPAVL